MKKKTTFVPNPEQLAAWPKISGNAINGLGEKQARRPTPILWHDPERLAHGKVQSWFWAQGAKDPALIRKRDERQKVIDAVPPPVAAVRSAGSPRENHDAVHRIAREAGADLVGIARLDPEWVFEGYRCDHPWIIVLGAAMDHAALNKAPAVEAALEVVDKYTKGWVVARPVEAWIRERGFQAVAHGGPMAGPINLIPPALAAGFGELGKHGSIINRQFGSSFRLSSVVTDLPLEADAPDEFAADDFCQGCEVCSQACPVDAIADVKQLVRGATKWYVDFDKCFTYFAETHGCAICIARCPWSFPDRAPSLAERWTARRERRKRES